MTEIPALETIPFSMVEIMVLAKPFNMIFTFNLVLGSMSRNRSCLESPGSTVLVVLLMACPVLSIHNLCLLLLSSYLRDIK